MHMTFGYAMKLF